MQHVLSAVRPTTLRDRLADDLDFSRHDLKEDFKGFLKHAIKLAEAVQIVDSGRMKKSVPERSSKSRNSGKDKDDETTKVTHATTTAPKKVYTKATTLHYASVLERQQAPLVF